MDETGYLIAGGIVLLVVGIGIGYGIARLRVGKRAAQDVQTEFDEYRQDVTEHFGRTAEHFQAIGQQYRELYEHMASGADALIDQQAMDEKLSFVPAGMIESSAEETITVEDAAAAPRDYADDGGSGDIEPSVDSEDSTDEPTDVDDVKAAAEDGDKTPSDDADEVQAAAEDGETTPSNDEPDQDLPPKAKTDDGEDATRTFH